MVSMLSDELPRLPRFDGKIYLSKSDWVIENVMKSMTSDEFIETQLAQRALSEACGRENLRFDANHNFPLSIRPTVLSRDWVSKVKLSLEALIRIADDVVDCYQNEPEVRQFFSAYESVRKYLVRSRSLTPLTRVCRFDGMISSSGNYKILETNTDCPASLFLAGHAGRLWRKQKNPIMDGVQLRVCEQRIVEDPLLFCSELISAFIKVRNIQPNSVCIVNYKGRFTSETERIVSGFTQLGIRCSLVDVRELRRDKGKVFFGKDVVDMVYNKWDLRDFVGCEEVKFYLEAILHDEVVNINPLPCQWLLADKGILALFSDIRFHRYFESADVKLAARHVPWTRVVTDEATLSMEDEKVNLILYAKSHKDMLVIKPRDATWSEGVLIGCKTDQSTWDHYLDASVGSGRYILQEYVIGHSILCSDPQSGIFENRTADLNTFLFGGQVVGFMSRASKSPIMSLYKGGAVLPVVVSDDD